MQDAERVEFVGVKRRVVEPGKPRVDGLGIAGGPGSFGATLAFAPFIDRVAARRDVEPVAELAGDRRPFVQDVSLVHLQEKALRQVVRPAFADVWNQLERGPDRLVVGSEEVVPGFEVLGHRRLKHRDELRSRNFIFWEASG